jgi:hypothetical protein
MWLSYDKGKSWAASKLLYPGVSAYSALAELRRGEVGILLEMDRYKKICFRREKINLSGSTKD